jgi:hypothetical protein
MTDYVWDIHTGAHCGRRLVDAEKTLIGQSTIGKQPR